MLKYLFLILLTVFSQSSQSQDPKILKGAHEFRKILLEDNMSSILRFEKVRLKLDSLGVGKEEFDRFCGNLSYVSRNLQTDEFKGLEFMVYRLIDSKAYQNLDDNELAILIENLDFYFSARWKIWEEKYPYKIRPNSLRLKEISQYGVKGSDRVLHLMGNSNGLCTILHLAFDSLRITHYPYDSKNKEKEQFEQISNHKSSTTSYLQYDIEGYPTENDTRSYDKVILDGIPALFDKYLDFLGRWLPDVQNLLKADGELIMSINYDCNHFDGVMRTVEEIDKQVEKMSKFGFKLKQRIYSENEYLVYRFSKK